MQEQPAQAMPLLQLLCLCSCQLGTDAAAAPAVLCSQQVRALHLPAQALRAPPLQPWQRLCAQASKAVG
eukprot:18889-Heterococcus_DN1.PRE.2